MFPLFCLSSWWLHYRGLKRKIILLLKADKFSLGVEGRSVMSGTRAISVEHSKIKNNVFFCLVAILIHHSMKNAKQNI